MRPRIFVIVASSTLVMLGCSASKSTAETPRDVTITAATFDDAASTRGCTSHAFTAVFEAIREDLRQRAPGYTLTLVSPSSGCTPGDVSTGAVDIAITDTPAAGEIPSNVSDRPFAASGIAIVANRSPATSGLTNISIEDLARIFGGKIDNFKTLGGGAQRILPFHHPEGSGKRRAFATYVSSATSPVDAPTLGFADYVAKIESTVGAIGYVTLTELDAASFVRILSLRTANGVIAPSAANIASGEYPLKTFVHLYTRADTTATALVFEYVASDAFQGRLASMRGLVPIRAMKETELGAGPRQP